VQLNLEGRWVAPRGASQSNAYQNDSTPYVLPAYGTLHATLSTLGWHLADGLPESRLLLAVRNLTDTRYAEPGFGGYDLPTLGRSFFLSAQQTF
jgi:iron complex outermembrane receptor protein